MMEKRANENLIFSAQGIAQQQLNLIRYFRAPILKLMKEEAATQAQPAFRKLPAQTCRSLISKTQSPRFPSF
jgi:hypothetical protein